MSVGYEVNGVVRRNVGMTVWDEYLGVDSEWESGRG